jgi:hypothetical protein
MHVRVDERCQRRGAFEPRVQLHAQFAGEREIGPRARRADNGGDTGEAWYVTTFGLAEDFYAVAEAAQLAYPKIHMHLELPTRDQVLEAYAKCPPGRQRVVLATTEETR